MTTGTSGRAAGGAGASRMRGTSAEERTGATVPSRARRTAVVVGLLLLPLAAIVLAAAPLLRPGGWTGAALVLAGALLLMVGIGLVSAPRARRASGTASRSPIAGSVRTGATDRRRRRRWATRA
jgi:hypothetical protein